MNESEQGKHDLPCKRILGIRFMVTDVPGAVDAVSRTGGLLVVPAAPALARLRENVHYRNAVLNADFAITDSAMMVCVWRAMRREWLPRISGLAYLRELVARDHVRARGETFWIMASEESAQLNIAWLHAQGFSLSSRDYYVAPRYGKVIEDERLLEILRERKPRHIVVTIGGGVQESLGWFLRQNLEHCPSIHCVGAAIAFLSGDQVKIPVWVDRVYLGWLFRCIHRPRIYVPRYVGAVRLFPLMLRYGASAPELQSS